MHPDDLKKVWLCSECGRGFAFNTDVEEHKSQSGHSKMMLCDLQRSSRKGPCLFMRGRTSISFRLSSKLSRVVIEYEYYPSSGEIRYVDVRYTDSIVSSAVEGNPEMMKKIDSYLRSLITENSPARS